MRGRKSAATAAEEAELRALSGQAERTRHAVGDTVQALAGKIADGTDARALARRGAAYIGADVRHAASAGTRRPVSAAGHVLARGARQVRHSDHLRAAAVGGPAVILAAFVIWQVRRGTSRR